MEGFEPVETTEYEFADGVLVRSVTRRTAEWSLDDLIAVAAVAEQRRLAGSHGQPLDEAMSPEGDPISPKSKYRYEVGLPVIDHAKAAQLRAEKSYREKFPDAEMGALHFPVERVEL